MNIRLIHLPQTRVAYRRLIGPYGPAIGAFWQNAMAPWMHSRSLDGNVCYGISLDDPFVTPAFDCRYDACVEVPVKFDSLGQAELRTLPGGRYAAAGFSGPPADLVDAWTWLTREWLPNSGLQCDARPSFEMFVSSTPDHPQHAEFKCDLCIPIQTS